MTLIPSETLSTTLSSLFDLDGYKPSTDHFNIEKKLSVEPSYLDKVMSVTSWQTLSANDRTNKIDSIFTPITMCIELHGSSLSQSSLPLNSIGPISSYLIDINKHLEQSLHYLDALEEVSVEGDEEDSINHRDLFRLEQKLDLLLDIVGKKDLDEGASFECVLSAHQLKLMFPYGDMENDHPVNFSQLDVSRIQSRRASEIITSLWDSEKSSFSSSTSFPFSLEELSQCFLIPIYLKPLTSRPLFFPILIQAIEHSTESRQVLIKAQLIGLSQSNIDNLEKYIFRQHRRAVASMRAHQ